MHSHFPWTLAALGAMTMSTGGYAATANPADARLQAIYTTDASTPICRPTARDGRCIAKSWVWRWGCMKHPMTASAC